MFDSVFAVFYLSSPGATRAEQTETGPCSADYYYSVLESPWQLISQVSCLQFTYRVYPPAALDVFVEYQNGSVVAVFNRAENVFSRVDNAAGFRMTRAIQPGTGKVVIGCLV